MKRPFSNPRITLFEFQFARRLPNLLYIRRRGCHNAFDPANPLANLMTPAIRLLLLALSFAAPVLAQDRVAYSPDQPGYHEAHLELAQFCHDNALYGEARKLANSALAALPDRARELTKAGEGKQDSHTASAWGTYLDRRESLQRRRAEQAFADQHDDTQVLSLDPDHAKARENLGQKWLDGVGWLGRADHERLHPLLQRLASAPEKAEREATWEKPYVLAGERFTLVTDLPYARALKYARLLDRFDAVFFELLGDVIPRRNQPNVVYCCKDAATFVAFSQLLELGQEETSSGLHFGSHGIVLLNAERCDYVGKRNKAHDNLARTLYHECTHRLVEIGLRGRRGGFASYELATTGEHAWIVESIAIVFEDLKIEKKAYKLTGLEAQRKYTITKYWKGKDAKPPALEPILKQGFTAFATAEPVSGAEKYAIAGTVAWYCLFEKKDKYRAAYLALLVDYYRMDTRGRDFEQRFGTKLTDFETEWRDWALRQG